MARCADDRGSDRLVALDGYDVLDTAPEHAFDDVTNLAAKLCEVPYALVSFVAADRQFFKSTVGIDVRETPLDVSICAHAIARDEPLLEIGDTLEDPRTAHNPLCNGPPNIRFYAGALLTSAEGVPVGTLCVLGNRPRELTDLQRQALLTPARQIMTALNLRLALRRQAVMQREIDHRVKNSLQSVASFVRLQAARHEDPLATEALEAVGRRVATVALLHQELALETNGDLVALGRYMEKVSALFGASAPPGVTVMAEFDPIIVDCSIATAAGALANEFVANSFKHAFPGNRTGTVYLRGRLVAEGGYSIRLSDDGVGICDVTVPASGLGTRIMDAAAAQIGGTIAALADGVGYGLEVVIPASRIGEVSARDAATRMIPAVAN